MRHTFDEVRSTVRAVGQWAKDTAAECGDPSTFEVEFGLTLSVKSGRLIGVLAEAGGEAALVVRLNWDRTTERTAGPTADAAGTSSAGAAGSATAGPTA
nr:CU044_2847 family protein [Kitasatospora sp. MMS16-BH015]